MSLCKIVNKKKIILWDLRTSIIIKEFSVPYTDSNVYTLRSLKDSFSFYLVLQDKILFYQLKNENFIFELDFNQTNLHITSTHLSNDVQNIYVLTNDNTIHSYQLNYSFNPQIGKITLKTIELVLSREIKSKERINDINEISLPNQTLVLLCSDSVQSYNNEGY